MLIGPIRAIRGTKGGVFWWLKEGYEERFGGVRGAIWRVFYGFLEEKWLVFGWIFMVFLGRMRVWLVCILLIICLLGEFG